MARIPEPNNIRKLKGERHNDRYLPDGIATEKLDQLPDPPDWWSKETIEIYQQKGDLLIAHNMLTALDISYLQQLCLIESKLNDIWKTGDVPPSGLITQFNSFCAHCGLSFISRQKVKSPASTVKTNKYAKHKRSK